MEDLVIKKNVEAKLAFEPGLSSNNIIVFVGNGIVTLTGRVKSYTEKYLAEQVVRDVRGVRAVVEELVVDLDASMQRNDAVVAESVLYALSSDVSLIPADKIKVIVQNGHVELTGEVDSSYQKERAKQCIRYVYGVRNINNLIKLKPFGEEIDPKLVSDEIMREFHRNASIDAKSIRVDVDGGKVTLKGTVRSWAEEKEARKAAWSVKGVTEVEDKLILSFS
jgi:osmotically-inducible protein OsmY